MGTYIEIDGDPDTIGATGARLRAMAETLRAQARSIQSEIETVHNERPWGSDSYGTAFEGSYYQVPEGCEEPLPSMVADGLTHAGERLTSVGDGTVRAMSGYQSVDIDSAVDIDRVRP
ncbi:hypothetical protein [Plantactinospora sp. GCM10030261]|uniref:hypothetical protein n=1 Tax=Plantactinospora sp. GCM10030261 TaxID=3273420 RepID=UPI00360FA1AD